MYTKHDPGVRNENSRRHLKSRRFHAVSTRFRGLLGLACQSGHGANGHPPDQRDRYRFPLTPSLRLLLKLAGKSERKVAAVFALSPEAAHRAVVYVCEGAVGIPIWLFATERPLPATAALCDRVYVDRRSLTMLWRAQKELWPRWVVLSVGTWTGERGRWLLKLAPFFIRPFRVLLANHHGDFFPGKPACILLHCRRSARDWGGSGWNQFREFGHRAKDLGQFYWRMLSHHVWRSGPATRLKDVCAAVSVLALATVLRWCSYPHRRLFRRWRGDSAVLDLRSPENPGDGIARYEQRESSWRAAALESLVHSSDARWVLWRNGELDGPLDDMRSLFEDPRTFAVSLQSNVRGWKPMLFPMAPFRTLQMGEASQVLCPISEAILVDRRKLAALGIPRCGLATTAWMLLFWKAAAAGWRSYSVGQDRALPVQPDFPAPEAAFALRVLLRKSWRSLCPREPDLSRGTIAFPVSRPATAAPDNGRLKVLIVSPFLPYPLAHGGAVRIYNLCRALADRVDFILVAIREAHDQVNYRKLQEIFREVYVADIDEGASDQEHLPEQVRRHQSRGLRALIADLCRRWNPDLMQIEYTHMAAFRDSASNVPAILVEHDLTFSLYRQLAAASPGNGAWREYQRWRAFERRWLGEFDGVWTMSEEERQAAIEEGRRDPERTFTIPNGVNINRFVPCEESAARREILFVGSFRHRPNVLGLENLRNHIMPRVWSVFPDAVLRVVAGPDHERFWSMFARQDAPGAAGQRIKVHGFVEDLQPYYARAAVVVVPLEVSAGTNIKVLEAMACGKAIVTTPVGCAGLGLHNGHDAIICADWKEFADAACGLLPDAELRSQIGAQARRTAEERFSWTAIQDRAYCSYLAVARDENRLKCALKAQNVVEDPSLPDSLARIDQKTMV